MGVKKSVDFAGLSLDEKGKFLGKKSKGFIVDSEVVSEKGVIEVTYHYDDWCFSYTCLIVPVLDSGYCQVLSVD